MSILFTNLVVFVLLYLNNHQVPASFMAKINLQKLIACLDYSLKDIQYDLQVVLSVYVLIHKFIIKSKKLP